MGKNKCLRYLLVIVLLALCSACSKKEEANTRSSFDDSLEFLEKMALQLKILCLPFHCRTNMREKGYGDLKSDTSAL